MRIEFSTIGDGTNVEVTLFEMLGDAEVVKGRFYSAQHQIAFSDDFGAVCRPGWREPLITPPDNFNVEHIFMVAEVIMDKPIIGGQFAAFHPYWHERKERRNRRSVTTQSDNL